MVVLFTNKGGKNPNNCTVQQVLKWFFRNRLVCVLGLLFTCVYAVRICNHWRYRHVSREMAVDRGVGSGSDWYTWNFLHNNISPQECEGLHYRLTRRTLLGGQSISDATHCPTNDKWINDFVKDFPATEDFISLHFGCNKGYDALATARLASRNTDIFSKAKWREALQIEHVGVCFQSQGDESYSGTDADTSRPQRPVEVHCVEAMPDNVKRVKEAAKSTMADQHGFVVSDLAIAGPGMPKTVMFPNSFELGNEGSDLESCNRKEGLTEHEKKKFTCQQVETITIDQYVKKFVDRSGVATNRQIPYLSIDIEGFDYAAMRAAKKTLQRTGYLEFEYHTVGDWRTSKLEDAIKMLKKAGFVCYWAGVNKLWRITDCWLDEFEHHGWSNVACVAPLRQPQLAMKMEDVFEDTLAGK